MKKDLFPSMYMTRKNSLNHNLQPFAGHCITLRHEHIIWFPKPVRYASVCSLQSAGKARSGAAGHPTDTRLIRSDLQDWERSTEGRRVLHCRGNIKTYAEWNERLYMSSPGDKKVRSHIRVPLISTSLTVWKNLMLFYTTTLYYYRFMAVLEATMTIPLCGLFLIFFSAMCFDALSIITVNI